MTYFFSEIIIYCGLFFSLYFGILMFIVFFEKRRQIYFKPNKQTYPFVSMIAPCYNEEKNIGNLLQSLISLNYPQNRLEILVVDDGSKDETLARAAVFAKKYPNIKIIKKSENNGKYSALNLGIKQGCGDIIGCIDADCSAEKNSLKKMVNYFQDKEVAAVVSSIKITEPKGFLLGIQHSEFLISAFLKKMFSFLGCITVTPGPLSLFRRNTLLKLGPYKEAHLTEDLEMALRMQSRHLKIVHAMDAIVFTKGQKNLKKLCRQRLRWNRGFLLNLNDYKNLLNAREHGNLSLMLAYNFFGVFLTIGLTGYSLFKIINYFIIRFNQALLINFDFAPYLTWQNIYQINFTLKPFFVLAMLVSGLMATFLILSKKYTFDKLKVFKKTLAFLFAYSFLNAFWWILACLSILFKKRTDWN